MDTPANKSLEQLALEFREARKAHDEAIRRITEIRETEKSAYENSEQAHKSFLDARNALSDAANREEKKPCVAEGGVSKTSLPHRILRIDADPLDEQLEIMENLLNAGYYLEKTVQLGGAAILHFRKHDFKGIDGASRRCGVGEGKADV